MVDDPLADVARLVGVPSAVASARDAVDAVLRDRGMRAISAEQSAAALLASARASASLSDDPDRWLAGSVRLSTELLQLSSLIRVSPGQAMARAHTLVASGELGPAQLGRIRAEPEISTRMNGLLGLLTGVTQASAIVLASVAHAELVTLAPFGTADTIVARAVEHMVLIDAGVDPRAVIVVEAGHLVFDDAYRTALTGYREGGTAGVRDWLLHCARALTYGAEVSPAARGIRTERK